MAEFKIAFDNTMRHEDAKLSGKVIVDAGGRTRFGIAEKFHPNLPGDFFDGPAEDVLAEAERIEQTEYWDRMRLAEIEDQEVANKLFDMAVNMGVHQASVFAQRAANGLNQGSALAPLKEDGSIGEKTLAAINAVDPRKFIQVLRDLSMAFYRHVASADPKQAPNLEGWLHRAEA